jgi:hypothetical protein
MSRKFIIFGFEREKYGNGLPPAYFDYDFSEDVYFVGGADPAERYYIIAAGELAGRDAHGQNVSLAGSLRTEVFSGEHIFSIRSE